MNSRSIALVAFLAAGAIGLYTSLLSAQQESRAKPDSVYAALAKVPPKFRARPNPLERDPDAVAAGGKLFELHCAECHGKKAGGTRRGPSLTDAQMQDAAPGELFWILTNGVVRHGMPVWSKLPEPQRWQIICFIKSLLPTAPGHLSSDQSRP